MAGKTPYKVGDTFYGKRKIVEYCGSHPKWRVSMWKWECMMCGTIHGPTTTATLTRKDRADSMPSCCHPRERTGNQNPRWVGVGEIPQSYFTQVRRSAEIRGIEFAITIEDMWERFLGQDRKCALSGQPLSAGYKNMKASIDRIDSSKGYTADNIQWVTPVINRIKSNLDQQEFIRLCSMVSSHNDT